MKSRVRSAAESAAQTDVVVGSTGFALPKITETDAAEISPARLEYALRTVARWMIRSHKAGSQPEANGPVRPGCSALTVVPHPSPHPDDETV